MTEPTIHGLFPTPVIFSNIDREFTKEEMDFFDEMSKTKVKNMGNVASADNYLMRHDVMKDIHARILGAVNHYMNEIVKPKSDVTPYVTQAWLNYTEPGQYHHRHEHPNSFLFARKPNIPGKLTGGGTRSPSRPKPTPERRLPTLAARIPPVTSSTSPPLSGVVPAQIFKIPVSA